MKAHSDNKTVYISDFIKQKHKKRRAKQLRVQLLIALYTIVTSSTM